MKEAGRNHEPGGESKWIGCGRQFRAMRVPMEDREERDDTDDTGFMRFACRRGLSDGSVIYVKTST